MDGTRREDGVEAALWNGPAGRAWVDAQALLDGLFQPFEEVLLEAVPDGFADAVLDVGCGTGSTALAVARRLAAGGSCTGVDVSQAMIAAARARADRVGSRTRFLCADAQEHAFAPASVGRILSRFGVMFFDDPVRAFRNLRRAAQGDARMVFVAWRSASENAFMTTAERAAAPLLPGLPARRPDGPGQFAFADGRMVASLLEAGGWSDVDVRPVDVGCTMPESDLVAYLTRLGPVGLALQQEDERTRARVAEAVRAAFDPYVEGDAVRFTAACWRVDAGTRSR